MPEYLPPPQLPTGLAEQLLALKGQAGNPWAALAQGLGQNVQQGVQNYKNKQQLTKQNALAQQKVALERQQTMLSPEQQQAQGITPGQSPGPWLPGAGQQDMPTDFASKILATRAQEKIAADKVAAGQMDVDPDLAKQLGLDHSGNYPQKFIQSLIAKQGKENVADTGAQSREKIAADSLSARRLAAKTKTDMSASRADEKTWQAAAKDHDISQASSRSLLGVAGMLNARADRALETLKSKNMTGQQLAGVTSDIAGILKGGTPDEQAEKSQGYGTAYTTIQNLAQYWSGKPQDAVPEEIKTKLREAITDLKKVDNKVLTDHAEALATKYEPLAISNPARFKKMQDQLRAKAGVDSDKSNNKNLSLDDIFEKHGVH